MGCSESKVLENVDREDSGRCVFTLVKPREPVPVVADTTEELPADSDFPGDDSGTEAEGPPDNDDEDTEVTYVTEHSPQALVNKVIRDFVSVDDVSDLVIIGMPCTRVLTGLQKLRREEESILETLRSEGLISKPIGRGLKGMSFEIVDEKTDRPEYETKVPNSVSVLEQSRAKFGRPLTTDLIAEKLQRAEERRLLQLEEDKKKRLTSGINRARALEDRLAEAVKQREAQAEKWEQGLKNREEHLVELRDKLKEKHQKIKLNALKETVNSHETDTDSYYDD